MEKYKPYPEYKPSGIDWLGKVPKHWETWKVTHGFGFIGSGTTPKSDDLLYYDGNVNWVTTSELRENTIYDTNSKLTEEALRNYSSLKIYPVDTLLFAMYGATIGRLGILGVNAAVNQACCAFVEPKVFTTKFVYYWLQMRRPTLIALSTGGGQPNLSQDDLKRIKIPVPSLSEQNAIVAFLDRQTAKIDGLIEKTQKLIKRLQEKRTALISHAVTKGLNPNVELKPSGIDWLGDVPKHWEIKKLKFFTSLVTNKADNNGSIKVGLENIEGFTSRYLETDAEFEGDGISFQPGDILYGKLRPYLAKVLLSNFGGSAVGDFFVLRPTYNIMPKYLLYRLLEDNFTKLADGSTFGAKMPRVDWKFMGDLKFSLPDIEEQKRIVGHIDRETAKIDTLIDKNQRLIKKLTEKRTALISAAVTGKIDVREI